MNEAFAVQVGVVLAAALVVLWVAYDAINRRRLSLAGYGVGALTTVDVPGRSIEARVVRLPDPSRTWGAEVVPERAFTVVSVSHSARVPHVVEYRGRLGRETEAYPGCEVLPTAAGSLEKVLDSHGLGFVRGVVQLGPEAAQFIEPGDLLEPDYLRAVTAALIEVVASAEKRYPNKATTVA